MFTIKFCFCYKITIKNSPTKSYMTKTLSNSKKFSGPVASVVKKRVIMPNAIIPNSCCKYCVAQKPMLGFFGTIIKSGCIADTHTKKR